MYNNTFFSQYVSCGHPCCNAFLPASVTMFPSVLFYVPVVEILVISSVRVAIPGNRYVTSISTILSKS